MIVLKQRDAMLEEERRAFNIGHIAKTFPFSTSKHPMYVCPQWAKDLLRKKY
jgi:hypothetical protein